MSDKRTLIALIQLGESVFVYQKDDPTGEAFLREAEAEGFVFGDGVKPTARHYATVMAIHPEGFIHYVGAVGMAAFQAKAENIVMVDYAAYRDGSKAFIFA